MALAGCRSAGGCGQELTDQVPRSEEEFGKYFQQREDEEERWGCCPGAARPWPRDAEGGEAACGAGRLSASPGAPGRVCRTEDRARERAAGPRPDPAQPHAAAQSAIPAPAGAAGGRHGAPGPCGSDGEAGVGCSHTAHTHRERSLQPRRGTSGRAEGLAALPRRPIATCRDGRRGCGGGRFPASPGAGHRRASAGIAGQVGSGRVELIPLPGGSGRIPVRGGARCLRLAGLCVPPGSAAPPASKRCPRGVLGGTCSHAEIPLFLSSGVRC
ncbi:collagen, type I, alpha 1a-like [Zonotrichia leucophrys gambelii]|uniref:collagen, type I, alpha 1a-like n=1 Tax=Zonotrichia leucophrys gambelii TaxID=257770 RepID=UPI003140C37D